MKKLYRKGTIHPSPSPSPPPVSNQLAFLPAAILTLLAALSQEDTQILAYFLSCPSAANFSSNHNNKSSATKGGAADHPPSSSCYCFNCYRSFWVRWDSSPDRGIIDEIIEAYEDGLHRKKEKSRRKEKKKGDDKGSVVANFKNKDDAGATDSAAEMPDESGGAGDEGGAAERGSVRRFVSFLGERFWSVWA
ncbi:unnamed protein product [Cuscuta epithymum]|uniref:Uncharacterized protein n=1 Tax=Cuscuta epithymum TaxID=186058 RepID=A0AAV0EQR1_9ASTE|nr:unnamed protein product [Cuscuta epithymum]